MEPTNINVEQWEKIKARWPANPGVLANQEERDVQWIISTYDALAREVEKYRAGMKEAMDMLENQAVGLTALVDELERQLADLKAEYAECERLNDTYEEKALRYAEQLAEAQQRIAELEARKPSPPIGTPVDCLVCGRIQPWGIWHEPTGVAVCVVCRDKAREL